MTGGTNPVERLTTDCQRKRRKRTMMLVVGVVTIAACVTLTIGNCFSSRTPDPEFQARSLSQWLETTISYDSSKGIIVGDVSESFTIAIQAIGTNAMPRLIKMLSAKDFPCRVFIMEG